MAIAVVLPLSGCVYLYTTHVSIEGKNVLFDFNIKHNDSVISVNLYECEGPPHKLIWSLDNNSPDSLRTPEHGKIDKDDVMVLVETAKLNEGQCYYLVSGSSHGGSSDVSFIYSKNGIALVDINSYIKK